MRFPVAGQGIAVIMTGEDTMARIMNVTTEQYQLILELVAMGYEVDIEEVAGGTQVRAVSRIDKAVAFTETHESTMEALRAVRGQCKRAGAPQSARVVSPAFANARLN